MHPLYPLRFRPIFRQYLWGGRRLGSLLGKSIGAEGDYAESWEVVDHDEDQSVVAHGLLAGKPLKKLLEERRTELLGGHRQEDRFPLLFKFLDCNRRLSVQVHPDDEYAATLDPPDLGKTEAWVVLHVDPGSILYAGLNEGVDVAQLHDAIKRNIIESCLHRIEPEPGDCVFIPAGTVHALGAGLVVAEVQQASDTTFRLYDWGRTDAKGKARELHIKQGLEVTDFDRGPVSVQKPQPIGSEHCERLVSCDKFELDRWQFSGSRTICGDGRFHVLTVLNGELRLANDPAPGPLTRGQTSLLPACLPEMEVQAEKDVVLLDAYPPSE